MKKQAQTAKVLACTVLVVSAPLHLISRGTSCNTYDADAGNMHSPGFVPQRQGESRQAHTAGAVYGLAALTSPVLACLQFLSLTLKSI